MSLTNWQEVSEIRFEIYLSTYKPRSESNECLNSDRFDILFLDCDRIGQVIQPLFGLAKVYRKSEVGFETVLV